MRQHKIFSDNIEGAALSQFYDAMKQDFVVRGALMPDAHAGYALPIGAVVATDGVVVPSWVGYDIGCGMCAVPTTFSPEAIRVKAQDIFDHIYRDVPVGFAHNKTSGFYVYDGDVSDFVRTELLDKGAPNNQVGTLGGGNHFIEIGEDESGVVWIITHTGSRNVGHKIASHYMKLASPDGKAREWHYGFDVDSDNGKDYIKDLRFGLDFALANRLNIIQRVAAVLQAHIDGGVIYQDLINRNHNHAEFKDGLWIHRKGATHAEQGMMGVIPGNMRDGSFIVRGKGNPESLFSSSHGAGRVLGRKAAKEALLLGEFIDTMDGVTARVGEATLDEAPMAYKDIFQVMREQSDLVEVLHHVKPIINIKG